jgi:hypothetical protein
MESLVCVNLNEDFILPNAEQVNISDSRFGIRRLFLTPQERPRIRVAQNPGRGASGESQD